MAKTGRARPVTATQVRAYAAKAEQFAAAAADAVEAGHPIAGTSLAIHAGINAADAVGGTARSTSGRRPP
jgi:hypothetical protein